jgi:hypothetical protein
MNEQHPTRDRAAAKSWENEGGSIAMAVPTGRTLVLANIHFVNALAFNRPPVSRVKATRVPVTEGGL